MRPVAELLHAIWHSGGRRLTTVFADDTVGEFCL